MINVTDYLDEHAITYVLHEHPAAFTCEDADKHCADIPGMACKNLLLKNKKKTRHLLVILPAEKRADLKQLGTLVGISKLSFASSETMLELLDVTPGAVSPFGLLNDTEAVLEVYLDTDVANAAIVGFHPNRNTATLELSQDMFQKFLELLPHEVKEIEVLSS